MIYWKLHNTSETKLTRMYFQIYISFVSKTLIVDKITITNLRLQKFMNLQMSDFNPHSYKLALELTLAHKPCDKHLLIKATRPEIT